MDLRLILNLDSHELRGNSSESDNGSVEEVEHLICSWENCRKGFARNSDMIRHRRTHTGERPYKCDMCGKGFIQRSALRVHIRTHTGEKPHHCQYLGCGKMFSDSSSFARHRRTHTGERPYVCMIPHCDKSYTRRVALLKHEKKHNSDKSFGTKHISKVDTQLYSPTYLEDLGLQSRYYRMETKNLQIL